MSEEFSLLILERAMSGDSGATREVVGRVYSELQRLAREKLLEDPDRADLEVREILQAACRWLLHRAEISGRSRRLYIAFAIEVMRRVVIDYVNERTSVEPGSLAAEFASEVQPENRSRLHLGSLESALETLERIDERCHRVFGMKYFVGLSIDEIAVLLEQSSQTIERDWQRARAFLYDRLVQ